MEDSGKDGPAGLTSGGSYPKQVDIKGSGDGGIWRDYKYRGILVRRNTGLRNSGMAEEMWNYRGELMEAPAVGRDWRDETVRTDAGVGWWELVFLLGVQKSL